MTTAPNNEPSNLQLWIKVTEISGKVDNVVAKLTEHGMILNEYQRSRWPLPTLGIVGGLIGTGAAVIAVWR